MPNHDLIRKINSGRVFALVGAGPSCELGYPTWEKLAQCVTEHVFRVQPAADQATYKAFTDKKDYPAIFRQAELDLGSRTKLIEFIETQLKPSADRRNHPIYKTLAEWPFACYLTTNYDDEIEKFLRAAGHHFTVVKNSQQELSLFRDGVSNLIAKLHGDLKSPETAILTSKDYTAIQSEPLWEYWRERMRQILATFDILIIGHSMNDPDLAQVMTTVESVCGPLQPVYMIVANATAGEIREYREKFNIEISSYDDHDGTHSRLRRNLSLMNHYVIGRDSYFTEPEKIATEHDKAACSLHLFRTLHSMAEGHEVGDCMGTLILSALNESESGLTKKEVLADSSLAPFRGNNDYASAADSALSTLTSHKYISVDGQKYVVTELGKENYGEIKSSRESQESLAFGQFVLDMQKLCPEMTGEEMSTANVALKNALVKAFESRGLALASAVFSNQSLSRNELPDVFRELAHQSSRFNEWELRAAFMDAATKFLLYPNEPQTDYIASISQGFFLYHLTGMDPACVRVRVELLSGTIWFADSSVLLPLFAKGCHNHEFFVELFEQLHRASSTLFTTQRLLLETWEHLTWALQFVKSNQVDSSEFLAAALLKGGYTQNLFIDGYIRLSAEGTVNSFADYVALCVSNSVSLSGLEALCIGSGISVLKLDTIKGFEETDWGEMEGIKERLETHRKNKGTFRGEPQVKAEAEVFLIVKNARADKYTLPGISTTVERVYFVSGSKTLDAISLDSNIVSWSPEAVYRYVTSVSRKPTNSKLLQQCMLQEYYYAGVSFIDKPRYRRFFGPLIKQSNISYQKEKEYYLKHVEDAYTMNELDEIYQRTPDLEKPFFVTQMAWQTARIADKRAYTAEERSKIVFAEAGDLIRQEKENTKNALEDAAAERKKRIRIEQQLACKRNLSNPKRVRRRQRQKKKRKNK